MLTLVTYAPAMNLPCPSPFGLKADMLIKMSGVDYKTKFGNPRKSPTKKLPLLKDGEALIADSSRIQMHLENRLKINFDGHLNSTQLAHAHALRAMIENHLYFCMVYFRWLENTDLVRTEFFGTIPAPVRAIVFPLVLKKVKNDLHSHGISRHSREDIIGFGLRDIDAIVEILDSKPYMMGDKPSSIDAVVYAFAKVLIDEKAASPLNDHARSIPTIGNYVRHMESEYA